MFAIDGPDDSKVRRQPNSRVNGSKNSPVAATMTEKNENPTEAASTSGQFAFHPGPIFTEVLLADEINRASPKTQSALLEAMDESQVSIDGMARPLPQPFFVIATQNPLHQVGTFPLPESQLDRFLMCISLGYPERSAERALLAGRARRDMLRSLPHAASTAPAWQMALSDVDIYTFQVDPASPLVDLSLAEIAFRQTYGVTILAIRRDGQTLANLGGHTVLAAGDQVIILGSPAQLAGLSEPFAQAESV